MTDRYIATSAAGEHVVHTKSLERAIGYASLLGGEVVDTHKTEGAQPCELGE